MGTLHLSRQFPRPGVLQSLGRTDALVSSACAGGELVSGAQGRGEESLFELIGGLDTLLDFIRLK